MYAFVRIRTLCLYTYLHMVCVCVYINARTRRHRLRAAYVNLIHARPDVCKEYVNNREWLDVYEIYHGFYLSFFCNRGYDKWICRWRRVYRRTRRSLDAVPKIERSRKLSPVHEINLVLFVAFRHAADLSFSLSFFLPPLLFVPKGCLMKLLLTAAFNTRIHVAVSVCLFNRLPDG